MMEPTASQILNFFPLFSILYLQNTYKTNSLKLLNLSTNQLLFIRYLQKLVIPENPRTFHYSSKSH